MTEARESQRHSRGIYVHFPYCVHHCHYCDFPVAVRRTIPQVRYTDAVLSELAMRAGDLEGPAQSLYLGGGTPSLWDHAQLQRVLQAARRTPGLEAQAEITLEANPVDVDEDRLRSLLDLGVTRLSLGVQSLRDPALEWLERRHDARQARQAIALAQGLGFESLSVDFIFGLPGQSRTDWRRELDEIAALDVPHLSVYALTVEPRTRLHTMVQRGQVKLDDDVQGDLLFEARDRLRSAGYDHYEVSSFARPGHRAVHNRGYWSFRPYLGIGAGAHGFLWPRRWRNLRAPTAYMAAAMEGLPTALDERLDGRTLSFERIMTGLRDLENGVALGDDAGWLDEPTSRLVDDGMLIRRGDRIVLTDKGLRFMDDALLVLLPPA